MITLPSPREMIPAGDIDSLNAAEAHLCKTDLRYLCREVLGFKDWDICHDQLAEFLDEADASTRRFRLILIPREHLKTSVVTIGKAIQHVLRNPNVTIMYTSAVLANSQAFLSEAREYLTSKSDLPKIFGNFTSDIWNSERIVVKQRTTADKQPTIEAAGADKATVSTHYDVIFADDLVNRQTINTPDQIAKTRKYYSDLFDLLKKPNGIMYLIGTRWDDKDLYGSIIKDEAELEAAGRQRTFDIHVRKSVENGELIFPKKFSFNILADLKQKKGSYEFSCQYMNEPITREDQQFKPPVRYWPSMPVEGRTAITIDLAPGLVPGMQENPDGDFNVITAMRFTPSNQMNVLEYRRGRFTVTDLISYTFDMVHTYRPFTVGIESVAYQRIFLYLLDMEMKRRKKTFSVTPIVPHKDKFSRIMGLQPLWERGDILLKPGMVELEEEFDRFPRGMHDDILDTLEMGLHLFTAKQPQFVDSKPYADLQDIASRREWESRDEKISRRRDDSPFNHVGQIGV